MRGLAALSAAAAVWLLAGAPTPAALGRPRPRWRPSPGAVRTGVAAGLTAITVAALALGLTAAPVVAASVGLLAASGPLAAASTRSTRRRAAIADRWPDVLAAMRGHLAGGAALPEAFVTSARRAGPHFEAAAGLVEDGRGAGRPFAAALAELRGHFADAIADRVLATLAEAHLAGGPRVGSILASLGASVADELRLRKAHDAALTQQRLTAGVALLAPWALLVLTVTTNPQAADAYRTPAGSVVVIIGAAATVAGYLMARRTARLSKPPRLFS